MLLWLFLEDKKPPSPGAFVGEAFPFYTSAAGEVIGFLYILWSSIRGDIALRNCSHGVAQQGDPGEGCPGPRAQGTARAGQAAAPRTPTAQSKAGFLLLCSNCIYCKFKKHTQKQEKKEKSRLSNEPGQKSLRIAFKSITSFPTAEFPLNLNPVE